MEDAIATQGLSPRESAFLERIIQIIDSRLTDREFTVEHLSREAGYSRSQLHRKLAATTGVSASRLILLRRLTRAQRMMKEQPHPVNDIARQVGFGSASYFTRCFREVIGMTPTEYVRHYA